MRRRFLARVNLPLFALACSAGVMGGLGFATFHYGQGASYLSNDPKACVNCHIMRDQYDSWLKSSHHVAATCNDCHTPHELIPKYLSKAENGFWHSKGFTLNDFHEPIRIRPRNAKVLNENCISCHEGMIREIVSDRHFGAEAKGAHGGSLNCIHCHASVGHSSR
jgi:cytochrome c nitrite reductase small subunit